VSFTFGSIIADVQAFFISSQPIIANDILNAINNRTNNMSLLALDSNFTLVDKIQEFIGSYFEYLNLT
jgi:hypothetical protein